MGQTSIKDSRSGAFAGQLAEEMSPRHLRTAIVAASKTATPGQPLIITGKGPNGEDLVRDVENSDTIDAATCAGICVLDSFREPQANGKYPAGHAVTVMREGVIYLQPTAAVANRAPVWVGNLTAQLGNIDDATGTGLVQFPGARWLEAGGTTAPARAHIRVNV